MSTTSVLIPQCGLAPGMVSILAAHLTADYEHIDSLTIRVGALPAIASNHLGYALTWSCAGLINEYCAPCDVIENGVRSRARALDDVESVTVGDLVLEAAHTSGGVGTLTNSYLGKAHTLNYKTLRYPGHFQYMRMFRDDLKLAEHKELAERWFSAALPRTSSDLVAIQIAADGTRVDIDNHRYRASNQYSHIVHATSSVTAIQQTTAHGCLAVVDAYLRGRIPHRGFVRQEELPFDAIAESPFFDVYRDGLKKATV
jgi:saccharopine dehydrogenase-like NADP-dependent oxidoreductase